MPLAKSAPQPITETPTPVVTQVDGVMIYDGLPLSVPNYFNVDSFKLSDTEKDRLNSIYEWAKTKVPEGTMGDVITKISELERQLGATAIGENRIDRLWRWCKLSFRIDDLEKERIALERRRWL
jgi:hypothetical protein